MITNRIRLENTIYKILLETESIEYTQTKRDNLTRNQRIALANFSKRTDIVINKADKVSIDIVLKNNASIRPIVSGCSGPTEKISAFLDHHLKPLISPIAFIH